MGQVPRPPAAAMPGGGAGEHRLLHRSPPHPLGLCCRAEMLSPGAGGGHGWSTLCFPSCRRVAALASCLAEATPLCPGVRSLCREGELEAGKLSWLCAMQQPQWSLQGQDARSARAASPSIRQPGPCPRTRGHPTARQPGAVLWVLRVLSATSHLRD